MKNHEMSLNPEPFEAIQSGTQRIETRINDEKRQLVEPGDNRVLVLGKSVFLTFLNLFSAINETSRIHRPKKWLVICKNIILKKRKKNMELWDFMLR